MTEEEKFRAGRRLCRETQKQPAIYTTSSRTRNRVPCRLAKHKGTFLSPARQSPRSGDEFEYKTNGAHHKQKLRSRLLAWNVYARKFEAFVDLAERAERAALLVTSLTSVPHYCEEEKDGVEILISRSFEWTICMK